VFVGLVGIPLLRPIEDLFPGVDIGEGVFIPPGPLGIPIGPGPGPFAVFFAALRSGPLRSLVTVFFQFLSLVNIS